MQFSAAFKQHVAQELTPSPIDHGTRKRRGPSNLPGTASALSHSIVYVHEYASCHDGIRHSDFRFVGSTHPSDPRKSAQSPVYLRLQTIFMDAYYISRAMFGQHGSIIRSLDRKNRAVSSPNPVAQCPSRR